MKTFEPITEHIVAQIIASALGRLDSQITAADVTITQNDQIPAVSDTPLGYEHVRIGLSPLAQRFAPELHQALKQLTGEAVTKSWTGDAVYYHAPLKELTLLTPEMLFDQWGKGRPPEPPYRGI